MNKKLKQLKKRICAAGMVVAAAGVSVPAAMGALPAESVYAGGPEIEINSTNFPDENFRKYVSEKIDLDGSGTLSVGELHFYGQDIYCVESEINDLTGVEHFEFLRSLSCWDNNLNYLNVSENWRLIDLLCDNNNLQSLDVSKNRELQALYCENNNLCSLDLSNNTELRDWDVRFDSQKRDVTVSNNEITLTDLDPQIKADRISNVIGAVLSGGKFTNITGDTVTYDYATGYEDTTMDVTLNIKRPDNRTGLYSVDGQWVYLKNGLVDTSFTGVAKNTKGKWMFVRNGVFDSSFTGVARSTSGKWIFVKNGRFYKKYTGVAKSTSGNQVYVIKGVFSKQAKETTGVAKNTKGKYVYVRNGRYYSSFTGLARSIESHKLVYVKKGKYYTKFTGKAMYKGKEYKVVKGRVVK